MQKVTLLYTQPQLFHYLDELRPSAYYYLFGPPCILCHLENNHSGLHNLFFIFHFMFFFCKTAKQLSEGNIYKLFSNSCMICRNENDKIRILILITCTKNGHCKLQQNKNIFNFIINSTMICQFFFEALFSIFIHIFLNR